MTYFAALAGAIFTLYDPFAHMESHPVPQNVTSFEFHLIGDMTIKQFAYLAAGLITAYLTFIFLFPVSPFAALPLIGLSAGLGVAFAFLPIADRPLDHWTVAFFKAVYSPTQRRFQMGNQPVDPKNPQFKNRLNLYLGNSGQVILPVNELPSVIKKPTSTARGLEITRLLSVAQHNSAPVYLKSSAPAPVQPSQPTLNQNVSAMVAQVIQQNQQLKAQLAQLQPHSPASIQLLQPASIQPVPPQSIQPQPTPQPMPAAPKFSAPVNYANTQIKIPPLTVAGPNIIAGTVVASNGAPVDGAIVIITNPNNIPVRAVKTSRTGQFNGATPLPDGEYILSCEKDGFTCDPVKVTLHGELLTPLTIQVKGGN